MTMDHRSFMGLAIAEGEKAMALDEVPVGAVIVSPEGEVIAQAHNGTESGKCATAHSELLAINQACEVLGRKWLKDCTIYVTMEPCPMCAGAIILARLERVVYGCSDSLWGGAGSIFNILEHPLTNPKPEVIGGICEDSCKKLLQDFFAAKRTGELL